MTILTALQSAAVRLVGTRPASIFSSTDQTELELADLANEVATDIMKGHPWRALTKIHEMTGDGVATSFPLPADYDRMVNTSHMHDGASWFWDYTAVPDLDTWMLLQDSGFSAVSPGGWIILDNQFQFYPAPATDAPARFPYISKNFARSAPAQNTGVITPQDSFTNDADTFALNERLITLGVIWKYREQKGMGYGEDMASYELALSQEQARDAGSRTIVGNWGNRWPDSVPAWPWKLG